MKKIKGKFILCAKTSEIQAYGSSKSSWKLYYGKKCVDFNFVLHQNKLVLTCYNMPDIALV